eukprot:gnl/Chilomastix_cuspidata/3350.p1 GENE.gnl/Chilomastix_cuspidata/3350~~gnl/Chilomastix_cuspidata/3350.p1  ORF type:complete len:1279 (+),score=510.37 gnl/Chilomastix_cuspidata/3350:68-3904(+)
MNLLWSHEFWMYTSISGVWKQFTFFFSNDSIGIPFLGYFDKEIFDLDVRDSYQLIVCDDVQQASLESFPELFDSTESLEVPFKLPSATLRLAFHDTWMAVCSPEGERASESVLELVWLFGIAAGAASDAGLTRAALGISQTMFGAFDPTLYEFNPPTLSWKMSPMEFFELLRSTYAEARGQSSPRGPLPRLGLTGLREMAQWPLELTRAATILAVVASGPFSPAATGEPANSVDTDRGKIARYQIVRLLTTSIFFACPEAADPPRLAHISVDTHGRCTVGLSLSYLAVELLPAKGRHVKFDRLAPFWPVLAPELSYAGYFLELHRCVRLIRNMLYSMLAFSPQHYISAALNYFPQIISCTRTSGTEQMLCVTRSSMKRALSAEAVSIQVERSFLRAATLSSSGPPPLIQLQANYLLNALLLFAVIPAPPSSMHTGPVGVSFPDPSTPAQSTIRLIQPSEQQVIGPLAQLSYTTEKAVSQAFREFPSFRASLLGLLIETAVSVRNVPPPLISPLIEKLLKSLSLKVVISSGAPRDLNLSSNIKPLCPVVHFMTKAEVFGKTRHFERLGDPGRTRKAVEIWVRIGIDSSGESLSSSPVLVLDISGIFTDAKFCPGPKPSETVFPDASSYIRRLFTGALCRVILHSMFPRVNTSLTAHLQLMIAKLAASDINDSYSANFPAMQMPRIRKTNRSKSLISLFEKFGIFLSNRSVVLFEPQVVYASSTPHPFPDPESEALPWDPLLSFIPRVLVLPGISLLNLGSRVVPIESKPVDVGEIELHHETFFPPKFTKMTVNSDSDVPAELILDHTYVPVHLRAPLFRFLVSGIPYFLHSVFKDIERIADTTGNGSPIVHSILQSSCKKILITGVIEDLGFATMSNGILVLRCVRPDIALEATFPSVLPSLLTTSTTEDAVAASLPFPAIAEIDMFLCGKTHPLENLAEFSFVSPKLIARDISSVLRLDVVMNVFELKHKLEGSLRTITSDNIVVHVPTRLLYQGEALKKQIAKVMSLLGVETHKNRSLFAVIISAATCVEIRFSEGGCAVSMFVFTKIRRAMRSFRPSVVISKTVLDVQSYELLTASSAVTAPAGVLLEPRPQTPHAMRAPLILPEAEGELVFFGSNTPLARLEPEDIKAPITFRIQLCEQEDLLAQLPQKLLSSSVASLFLHALRRHLSLLQQQSPVALNLDAFSFGWRPTGLPERVFAAVEKALWCSFDIVKAFWELFMELGSETPPGGMARAVLCGPVVLGGVDAIRAEQRDAAPRLPIWRGEQPGEIVICPIP